MARSLAASARHRAGPDTSRSSSMWTTLPRRSRRRSSWVGESSFRLRAFPARSSVCLRIRKATSSASRTTTDAAGLIGDHLVDFEEEEAGVAFDKEVTGPFQNVARVL